MKYFYYLDHSKNLRLIDRLIDAFICAHSLLLRMLPGKERLSGGGSVRGVCVASGKGINSLEGGYSGTGGARVEVVLVLLALCMHQKLNSVDSAISEIYMGPKI